MSDHALLLAGLAFLYLPGAVLIVACRIRRLSVLVGMAPIVTIALLQLAALARWGLGTGLGVTVLGTCALVAVVAVVLEVRAGRDAVTLGMAGNVWRSLRARPLGVVVGAGLLATACWLGASSWVRGFAGLSTPPQEHDTVMHTLITAYIAFTGHAGPFEVMPTDLATGSHIQFYPAGAHVFAGLLSMLSGNPVSGLNATTALILGVAAPVTLCAAASAFEPRRTWPVFAALTALLAVTLYRPYFQLAHDAGILAFAMGLALAPALATGLAALRDRDRGMPVVLGLAALGLFAVHPSLAVVAVVVLVVAGGVAALSSAGMRQWTRARVRPLLGTALASVVLTFPWLLASLSAASSVTSYPEAPPRQPLGDVLRQVTLFNYGGFFDHGHPLFQLGFAALFWLGFLGCLTRRRLWPLAAAWVFWAAAAVLYAAGHARLPVLEQLGSIFYNSWTRIDGVGWLLAPAVAGLGLASLVTRATDLRLPARARLTRVLAPAAALAVAAVFLVHSGIPYVDANTEAVAQRWGHPMFYRLAPGETKAFDYLAQHRDETGRVLNNANDGSTFLYVYTGIPVVNNYPEGQPEVQYGIYLMQHFNEIGTDPVVRCLVQRYDITHVLVSLSSPPIPGFALPGHWLRTKMFSYAPGFLNLVDVPQVHVVFADADTAVFRIDPSVLHGDDRSACTADPEHPLPARTAG